MKTLSFNGIITSLTAKVDGSIGLRIATPELSPAEKTEFFKFQNINSVVTLDPLDEKPEAGMLVEKNRETKTPSQRLRNVIFALHKTKLEQKEYIEPNFEVYYNNIMESFINKVKEQLEAYE